MNFISFFIIIILIVMTFLVLGFKISLWIQQNKDSENLFFRVMNSNIVWLILIIYFIIVLIYYLY
jgi:hypothetical protein